MPRVTPRITNPAVARAFDSVPPAMRRKLMALRALILTTAATTDGVGPIEETLKWGEPAYLTTASGSGSTIRLGWKSRSPAQYAMYFNCQTTLVESFRTHYPGVFTFEGNRAIVFQDHEPLPIESLSACIATALTYHLRKTPRRSSGA